MCNLPAYYFSNIKNIKIDDIKNTTCDECMSDILRKDSDFSHYKIFIKSNEKLLLKYQEIDMVFGLYTLEDDCEYKISCYYGTISKGNILKNKLTYILPIPVVCVPYVDIYIESTHNMIILCSILSNPLTKLLAANSHKIPNFDILGGILRKTNDVSSCFHCLNTYTIEDKINNIDKSKEFIQKFNLELTNDDAKIISQDINLLSMFIDKRIEINKLNNLSNLNNLNTNI